MENPSRSIVILLFLLSSLFSCENKKTEDITLYLSYSISYEYKTRLNQIMDSITVEHSIVDIKKNMLLCKTIIKGQKQSDSITYCIDSSGISINEKSSNYMIYSFMKRKRECEMKKENFTNYPIVFFVPGYSDFCGLKKYNIENKTFQVYKFIQNCRGLDCLVWSYFLKDFGFLMYIEEGSRSICKIKDINGYTTLDKGTIDLLIKNIENDSSFFIPKPKPIIPLNR